MTQSKSRYKIWYEQNKERISQYYKEYNARPEIKEKRRIRASLEWQESKKKRMENTFG